MKLRREADDQFQDRLHRWARRRDRTAAIMAIGLGASLGIGVLGLLYAMVML